MSKGKLKWYNNSFKLGTTYSFGGYKSYKGAFYKVLYVTEFNVLMLETHQDRISWISWDMKSFYSFNRLYEYI